MRKSARLVAGFTESAGLLASLAACGPSDVVGAQRITHIHAMHATGERSAA